MMEVDPGLDLPLLANAEEIRVRHYMIRLKASKESFNEDQDNPVFGSLQCEVVLFLEAVDHSSCQSGEGWNLVDPSLAPKPQVSSASDPQEAFKLILDAKDLDIVKISSLDISSASDREQIEKVKYDVLTKTQQPSLQNWFNKTPSEDLPFVVKTWSLEIWKDGCKSAKDFPKVPIVQNIVSDPGDSPSNGVSHRTRTCVHLQLLPGMILCYIVEADTEYVNIHFCSFISINNRSLFPCQEPPVAMATWQAEITAPDGYQVVCSGDQSELVESYAPGHKIWYFYTTIVLPMSTFALAIGPWESLTIVDSVKVPEKSNVEGQLCPVSHEPPYPCHLQRPDLGPVLPTRLFGTPSMLKLAKDKNWLLYVPACLQAAYELLGRHPFQRLDILIVPRCFSGLGLASPSVMFVSQSLLLHGDFSQLIRIAHEVSHSWFGLILGARDWTEEWLSEGFATFMEDFIHTRTMSLILDDLPLNAAAVSWSDVSTLRALIRYKTLKAELDATSEDLQKMRPMLGQELRHSETQNLYVKNGRNPETVCTQVHYIKGYFLLHHLHDDIAPSSKAFFDLLRHYVHDLHHGSLVHSTDFLKLFFEAFQDSQKSPGLSQILTDWLNPSGMPPGIAERYEDKQLLQCGQMPLDGSNTPGEDALPLGQHRPLQQLQPRQTALIEKCVSYREVSEELEKWKDIDKAFRRPKRKHKQKRLRKALQPEQLVLLLEDLIQMESLSAKTLKLLYEHYQLSACNADVLHRWCELVLMYPGHCFNEHRDLIKWYLEEHQAMGIYLYGEMATSKSTEVKGFGLKLIEELKSELDYNYVANITEMFDGQK